MGITTNNLYHIEVQGFETLFNKIISPNDNLINDTLKNLKIQAERGNTDAIDVLLNITLRKDEFGQKAENIIWDLYNKETCTSSGIDKDIENSCTTLYETVVKMKDFSEKQFKTISPKLLYITGNNAPLDLKIDIKNNVINQDKSKLFDPDEDIWKNNRMLYDNEINMINNTLTNDNNVISAPLPVYDGNDNDALATLLAGINPNPNNVTTIPSGYINHFIPVNIADHKHFILINLRITNRNEKPYAETTIFNSYTSLPTKTKEYIKNIINKNIKIDHNNEIEVIERNIQDYMPNSCGVHIIEAMKHIINNDDTKPGVALNNYINMISNLSIEEKQRFNAIKRREYLELAFRQRNEALT